MRAWSHYRILSSQWKSYNDGIYKDVHVTIIGPGLDSDYICILIAKIYNVGESSLIIMYSDQE